MVSPDKYPFSDGDNYLFVFFCRELARQKPPSPQTILYQTADHHRRIYRTLYCFQTNYQHQQKALAALQKTYI